MTPEEVSESLELTQLSTIELRLLTVGEATLQKDLKNKADYQSSIYS